MNEIGICASTGVGKDVAGQWVNGGIQLYFFFIRYKIVLFILSKNCTAGRSNLDVTSQHKLQTDRTVIVGKFAVSVQMSKLQLVFHPRVILMRYSKCKSVWEKFGIFHSTYITEMWTFTVQYSSAVFTTKIDTQTTIIVSFKPVVLIIFNE